MKYLALIFLGLVLRSCNDCRNEDCPPDIKLRFEIIDSQSGDNLLTIPGQPYSFDSLRVVAVRAGGFTDINVIFRSDEASFPVLTSDSLFIVNYGSTDADTLVISEKSLISATDCCDGVVNGFNVMAQDSLLCTACENETVRIVKQL